MFATCTGRLSALMEHQWLMQDRGADRTEAMRDAMAGLLGAVVTPDTEVRAMSLRIEAKVAEAALLGTASFGAPDQAAWARAHIPRC
jgi:hypothetical protein